MITSAYSYNYMGQVGVKSVSMGQILSGVRNRIDF